MTISSGIFSCLLQLFHQAFLGLDPAAAHTLPPPGQLALQQKCVLPRPSALCSGGCNRRLVRLHRDLLLHRECDWFVLWNRNYGCSQERIHLESQLQAGWSPLGWLWHLGPCFHPGLFCPFNYGGNGPHGVHDCGELLGPAQDGSQLPVHCLEPHCDYLGVDVCLHCRLLPWSLS